MRLDHLFSCCSYELLIRGTQGKGKSGAIHYIPERKLTTAWPMQPLSFRTDSGSRFVYFFPGGDAKGVTPVPFPNTEVKSFRADGTAGETLWESRTPPDLL